MSYSLDFINIGCNRVAGCSHWGRNGLLAYGAGRFVGLMDVEHSKLLHTLPGHSGRVNSVRWIPPVAIGVYHKLEHSITESNTKLILHIQMPASVYCSTTVAN